MVLADRAADVPSPLCLVRLLVTAGSSILVEDRPDGRGLDIPTGRVHDGAWEEPVQQLLRRTVGSHHPSRLLGYVRNTVPAAPTDYPWPSPYAHFAVWHCALPTHPDAPGTWLDAIQADAELGDRHWWPLAAHATPSRR